MTNSKDKEYYAKKMKESRERRAKNDKLFWSKYVYVLEIGDKKYIFKTRKDVSNILTKVDKKIIQSDLNSYIPAF